MCQTCNPAVPGSSLTLETCWICSWLPKFKSSAALVNSQLVASCQLVFLIFFSVGFELFVSKYLSGVSVN